MSVLAGGTLIAILETEIVRLRAENKELKERNEELEGKNKALQNYVDGFLKLFKKYLTKSTRTDWV